jgi:hypothetical protein
MDRCKEIERERERDSHIERIINAEVREKKLEKDFDNF